MFIYASVLSNHHSHSQLKNLFFLLPLSSSLLNSSQDLKFVLDRIPLGLLPQIRRTLIWLV